MSETHITKGEDTFLFAPVEQAKTLESESLSPLEAISSFVTETDKKITEWLVDNIKDTSEEYTNKLSMWASANSFAAGIGICSAFYSAQHGDNTGVMLGLGFFAIDSAISHYYRKATDKLSEKRGMKLASGESENDEQ